MAFTLRRGTNSACNIAAVTDGDEASAYKPSSNGHSVARQMSYHEQPPGRPPPGYQPSPTNQSADSIVESARKALQKDPSALDTSTLDPEVADMMKLAASVPPDRQLSMDQIKKMTGTALTSPVRPTSRTPSFNEEPELITVSNSSDGIVAAVEGASWFRRRPAEINIDLSLQHSPKKGSTKKGSRAGTPNSARAGSAGAGRNQLGLDFNVNMSDEECPHCNRKPRKPVFIQAEKDLASIHRRVERALVPLVDAFFKFADFSSLGGLLTSDEWTSSTGILAAVASEIGIAEMRDTSKPLWAQVTRNLSQ